MLEVHARDWEIALFLPTEQFRKKGKQTIWGITRKEIREQRRVKARAKARREKKAATEREQQRLQQDKKQQIP